LDSKISIFQEKKMKLFRQLVFTTSVSLAMSSAYAGQIEKFSLTNGILHTEVKSAATHLVANQYCASPGAHLCRKDEWAKIGKVESVLAPKESVWIDGKNPGDCGNKSHVACLQMMGYNAKRTQFFQPQGSVHCDKQDKTQLRYRCCAENPSSNSAKQLVISSAIVDDFTGTALEIEGVNFDSGDYLLVTLGNKQLTVVGEEPELIEAGAYVLTVSTGTDATQFDADEVIIEEVEATEETTTDVVLCQQGDCSDKFFKGCGMVHRWIGPCLLGGKKPGVKYLCTCCNK
jgi:hypothetical protein